MKKMDQSNVAKLFIITLIVVGIIFGLIYFKVQPQDTKALMDDKLSLLAQTIKSSHQNMLLEHLTIIIILLFLSYSIIGVPLILFYLFYECSSLGFLIASFYASFKIKGILFSLVYILISKLLYIICIVYIAYVALKITKKMLRVLIYKEQESLYKLLKNLFLKLFIVIIVIVIYDLFLYFFANKILKLFIFLIK